MGDGLKRGYVEHCEKVRRIAPKERLLEFEVARDDWTKLATFLDKPIPPGPFPRVNDTATFQRKGNFLIVCYASLFFP
jgi:Sulfotransferase domain